MTEGPYKLPEGWRWVRLGEIATEIQNGFAFRKKNAPTGDVLQLRPYNIGDNGELDLSQKFFVPRSVVPAGWSWLQPGDVLFNNTNSVELVGKTALVREEMEAVFSNHITRIRVRPDMCEGAWLAIVLNALWRQGFFAKRCNRWIGQAGYNTESLRETPIPLPPLEEQRRIVARIEELMALVREARRLRKEALEDAERLWQSVLANTFPRPGQELPEGWRWVRLGEVANICYGRANPKRPGHIPVVGSGGVYDYTETALISFPTVVIGRKGSAGEAILIREPCWPSDTTFYLEWLDAIMPEWVALWLKVRKPSPESTTATLPSLRREDLELHPLPLPPLEEQRRIVVYLQSVQERIQALREAQSATEAELQRLEQAILDKAFRGGL